MSKRADRVEDFIAATFTPMKENGDVNLEAIDKYQQFLLDQGINYVYVNGSTGEGTSLTTSERKSITEQWITLSRKPGREMKVFVQVGGTNFRETLELAEHAAEVGADAFSALPPLYFVPATVDELVDYCRQVAEKAPSIPFYYYHIPERTNVRFDMEQFLIKSRNVISNLRGIKFSSKDLYEGSRCLRTLNSKGENYELLFGSDEQIISAFAIGFKGAIGTTYSIIPRVYQKLKKAFDAGHMNEAASYQYRSADFVKVCFEFGSVTGGLLPAVKFVLSQIGVDAGPPRYPMKPLDNTSKQKLMDRLNYIKFFDWHSKAD
ncbi:N-acetylneuraminate lyase [Biomphalaria pfeifferi]|uniref:N-acetylneuraminate lyase n=1 Tax=Biomphalaria pfeifferi TaxID=112525 RepID=A0AAD8BW85_BIOPF|nr:N-acetylneuraminate lyase [Biomphalaria pfeifferi]